MGAVTAWREALALLPPESVQSKKVSERLAALMRDGDRLALAAAKTDSAPSRGGKRGAISAALASAALLLSKFKLVVLFALTKLKFLALGIGKASTLFSMLLSIGVYWAAFGWPFALGFVACLYVHEMGHVAALERLGIKATPPMFVPGFGAFVRLKQYPASPSEDARVGLAGPIWGMASALVCFLIWRFAGYGIWGALAEWSARINLFNLVPYGSLDGGRGFRALSSRGRWLIVAVTALAWIATREGMLILVLIVGGLRAATAATPTTDRRAAASFAILVIGLALLSALPMRMGLQP